MGSCHALGFLGSGWMVCGEEKVGKVVHVERREAGSVCMKVFIFCVGDYLYRGK